MLLFSYNRSFPDFLAEGTGLLYTVYILCFIFSQLQPRITPTSAEWTLILYELLEVSAHM